MKKNNFFQLLLFLQILVLFSILSPVIACDSWGPYGWAWDDTPSVYTNPNRIRVGTALFYFPPNSPTYWYILIDLINNMKPGEQLHVQYRKNECPHSEYYRYDYIQDGGYYVS